MTPPLLDVADLVVEALTPRGPVRILDRVGLTLARGETLAVAGASGSGKSVTALALLGLLPRRGLRVASGAIRLDGRELTTLPEPAWRALRGCQIAMIFQEPMTALNPLMTVGAQIAETVRAHRGGTWGDAMAVARAMLDAVRIDDAGRRLGQFPHELSGGMRQRVMIGMALSCRPKVLIADEPTTALDVTVQAQMLALMRDLKADFDTSILLITHDMGVVAEMADRVVVMQAGRVVEEGDVAPLFAAPRHAHTAALLAAAPRLGAFAGTDGPPRVAPRTGADPTPHAGTPAAPRPAPPPAAAPEPVVEVADLVVAYGRGAPPAVDGVSLVLHAGETLGLVGESGSGKSTTGKAILNLVAFRGRVRLDGVAVASGDQRAMKPLRRVAQMIFQDPYASLDPRMTCGALVAEPLAIHAIGTPADRRDRVAALFARVRLAPDIAARYPHELSGGQRQRVCIARALAIGPKVIVADESVAALDGAVRGQVLDLMLELQQTDGLAYLFISHDMGVVEWMCHRVAVMHRGRIVEQGPRRAVFEAPSHPYTRALLDAVPMPDPTLRRPPARAAG